MILKSDLDVSIAYGATCIAPFNEPWLKNLADPNASSIYVEFRYRGAVIDRQVYVRADGSRQLLPLVDFDESSQGWHFRRDKLDIPTLLFNVNSTKLDADLEAALKFLGVQIL